MKAILFRIRDEDYERIANKAQEVGISKAAVVKLLISRELAKNDPISY